MRSIAREYTNKACGEADQLAALVFMRRLCAWLVVRRRNSSNPTDMRPIPRPRAGRTHHSAPAQEMTTKIGPSYRSIIAHKLARGLDLMSQVFMSQVFDPAAGEPGTARFIRA